jgi:hypothetical protein
MPTLLSILEDLEECRMMKTDLLIGLRNKEKQLRKNVER